jgi:hypothetical protein
MATKRKTVKKQASQVADIGDVQEFAATVKKQAFIECRGDGHNMGPHNVTMDENGTFLRTRRCRKCGYLRHYVVSGGHILNAKSEYPDGYLLPRGTGRLDADGRAVFREAAIEAEYRRKAGR